MPTHEKRKKEEEKKKASVGKCQIVQLIHVILSLSLYFRTNSPD